MILSLLPSTNTQHSHGWLHHPPVETPSLIACISRDDIGKPQAELPTKYSNILDGRKSLKAVHKAPKESHDLHDALRSIKH